MAKKKTERVPVGRQYDGLLSSVSELLEQARRTSARVVNTVITATYWEVGRRIVEHEQSGESRAGYGTTLLKKLSVDLTSRFGRGFSERNLEQMRLFYTLWPISQTLSAKSEIRGIPQTLSAESDILHTPSEISETPSRKSSLSRLTATFLSPGLTTFACFLSRVQKHGRSTNPKPSAADGFSLDDNRQKIAENGMPDIIAHWKNKNLRHPERSPERAERDEGRIRRVLMAANPSVQYHGDASLPAVHEPAGQAGTPYRQENVGTALSMTRIVGRAGKCFLVPAGAIRTNKYDLSISRYKEIERRQVEYEKPHVILRNVLGLEEGVIKEIEDIDRMLK